MIAPSVRPATMAAGLALLVLTASCGLPGGGSVTRVDDDEVPYRLLESSSPSPEPPGDDVVSDLTPVLVWLADDHLIPEPASEQCGQPLGPVIQGLLAQLSRGPSDEARDHGLSTAIPAESRLTLSEISAGTAQIDFEAAVAISAELLPSAVGQIVLTVTSVPDVDSVILLRDGEPVQAPLPGGALSSEPVSEQDYRELLPKRLQHPGRVGCVAS